MSIIVLENSPEQSLSLQLVELQEQCFCPPWTKQQIDHQLTGKRGFNFAWQVDNKLVGYVFYQLLFEQAEIIQIAIQPQFQKQGLAAQLLTQSSDYLQQQQIEKILLEVRESNRAAIALYTKLGFVVDGIRRNYYPANGQSKTREHAKLYSLALAPL